MTPASPAHSAPAGTHAPTRLAGAELTATAVFAAQALTLGATIRSRCRRLLTGNWWHPIRMSAMGGKRTLAGLAYPMLPRVQFIMLLVAVAVLVIAAALAVLSMLPQKWLEAPPERPTPLAVELIEPGRTGLARPTRGMVVGRGGFGTILSAPGRQLVPSSQQPAAGEPTLAAEPPVAAQVAALVRLLARLATVPASKKLIISTLEEPPRHFGTITLRDGCLKLAEAGEPHAILPQGTKLYIDDDGYLTAGVIANGTATNPRLGEPSWWTGGTRLRVDTTAVARIRAKCGPGAARLIGPAQSVAASQAAADGAAARNLVNMYGVPWTTALAQVRNCRKKLAQNSGIDPLKMIENLCGSTPPSPVADPRSCPSGTSFSGGLCRTPAGHIRPIPAL